MIPRPPRRTLFPYTTLFRSPSVVAHLSKLVYSQDYNLVGQALPENYIAQSMNQPLDELVLQGETDHRVLGNVANNGDRKSTRLNSSHVKISYAVFCLKKKKT